MRSNSGILFTKNRKNGAKRPLRCEALEDRRVLATFTVLNTADAGAGSLRQAILDSNAAAGADTINFAAAVQGATINLTSATLTVTDDVSIDASAGAQVTVNGNNTFRIFKIDDGAATNKTVSIDNLKIQNGNANLEAWTNNFETRRGGGIDNRENLTIRNSTITNNAGRRGGGISTAGINEATSTPAGERGSLAIINCIISNNFASNDQNGTANASGGRGAGIAVYNVNGAVTVQDSIIEDNLSDSIGGAIDVSLGVTMTVTNTIMRDNLGKDSGAVAYISRFGAAGAAADPTVVVFDNVTITGNTANTGTTGNAADNVSIIQAGQGANVTIRNSAVTNNTILSNSSTYFEALLHGQNVDTVFNLDNVTVSGNTAADNVVAVGFGTTSTVNNTRITGNTTTEGILLGAIGYSDMTITNSDISGNTSSAGFIFSGAVTAGDDCTVTVSDTTIRNNVGIMGAAAISYDVSGSLRLERTTITGNSNGGVAADQYGSGLVGSIVEVIDSTVSGNGFISGNPNPDAVGGFYSRTLDPTYSAGSSLTIRNSTVNGNYSGGNGGGVFARYTEAVNIENSTINGNQAPLYAGGGVAGLSSNITITRSTISNNTSIGTGGNGAGGIFMLANSPSATSLTVKQSTISGNSTSGDGGAIIMYAGAGYTVSGAISGSTITNNRADSDGDAVGSYGGVYVGYAIDVTLGVASLTITGSILAGNTDPNGQSPDLFDLGFEEGGTPNVTSVEFSLIGSNVGNALAVANPGPDANGNKVGTTGNLLNPNLGALGNNGGPTSTHKPNAGSPAINAGNTVQTEATDQRGLGRVGGGRADMGSVESEFTATPDGDFDNNGIYNCADIDALANAIATGGSVATFDLNGDNALTIADQDVWRAEAGGINIGAGRVYKVGDANLDGGVDGSDFGLWNSNKFTNNKDWCKGNFNADGVTDGSDFGLWNANKFTASDEGRSETGLASDDVVVSSNQGAARSRTSRIMDSAKPMNRESNKAQAVSNAREEFGTAARRAPVAAPKAAAVESFTAKTVSVKSEEAKVVALPTLSTSSTASSFDATRNSTSRQVKKVAAHDSIFSMWGAE